MAIPKMFEMVCLQCGRGARYGAQARMCRFCHAEGLCRVDLPEPTDTIQAVVNGQPVDVAVGPRMRLNKVLRLALAKTHNGTQPLTRWEMRDRQGTLLHGDLLVKTVRLWYPGPIFINLTAGWGG